MDANYAEAAREAAQLVAQISDFNVSAAFCFANYPMTRKRCDELLERLRNSPGESNFYPEMTLE